MIKSMRRIITAGIVMSIMVCMLSGLGIKLTASAETESLEWLQAPAKVKVGKKITLKVNIKPEDVQWSVSNGSVATTTAVSSNQYAAVNYRGILTGKSAGTVTVTAKTGDRTLKCKIKVVGRKKIAIDAGHQAKGDSRTEPVGPGSSVKKAKVAGGATGVSSRVPEYKFTLSVAKKLKKELINRGYDVYMIRTTNNVNISNKKRAQLANKSGSDIYIRLHGDSIGSSSVKGASAFYPSGSNRYVARLSKSSKKLTTKILNAYCKKTGIKKRGASARDDLTGTNWSEIPVTLIELGFLSNPAEDRKMQKSTFQKKMAAGIANGIDAYFGY